MALTVIFALVGALVLALTVVPALCSVLLRGRVADEENRVMRLLRWAYAPLLAWAFRFRVVVISVAIVSFVISIPVLKRLGAEFVPQLDEGSTVLMLTGPASVSVDMSLKQQLKAEKLLLKEFPEIKTVYSRIGTAEVQTDPMGPNLSDTFISFHPPEKWRKIDGRTATREELSALMAKTIEENLPGIAAPITQPIEMRFNELLEGARADIAVKIFGDDFETLGQAQTKVREILESIPGTGDAEFDAFGKSPTLEITLNRTNMVKYNTHAAEVNKTVAAALGGARAGTFIEGNRRFDIVVRMPEMIREKIEELGQLPLRTEEGGLIPISKVASIAIAEQVGTINREAGQRRAAILVNLRGRDLESWVNEAQQKISQEVKMPDGYFIEFGGAFKNLQAAQRRLMIVVPLALALIFLLIFTALSSIRQTLLVCTAIPLAVTGGIFALALRGLPFSISAGVGFIALSGVAVLNGLVMISYFNSLQEQGRTLRDAVIEGSLTRLRPVLMTAMVASFGFVPMAVATGSGAEVQRPLATVVIGGIITSTFLTLVLLPVLYEWLERNRKPTTEIHT